MKRIIGLLFGFLLVASANAATLAGVEVPDSAQVANTNLVLNGVGLRTYSIFGVKIYIGALYLPAKTGDPAAVVAHEGPDRVLMRMIHSVSKGQFADAWHDDFKNNNPQSYDAIKDQVEQFIGFFADSKEGDVITMDYIPGQGTQVSWNGAARGTIPGEDFHKAFLNIYMGPKPPTDDLKAGMLGKS
ncbi:MAG: chalcone isomerase family protein [Bacillota bacterium]